MNETGTTRMATTVDKPSTGTSSLILEKGWRYTVKTTDRRRLVCHREKDCDCCVCFRELAKLPPRETNEEWRTARMDKLHNREVKKVKNKARKEVKAGKQTTIKTFLNKNPSRKKVKV